jgi:8-amino-7-oxononanoate synthase
MPSLDAFAQEKLDRLERENLRRVIVPSAREGIWVGRQGRRLLSFSCNDYLNLTQHPRVKAAAIAAIEEYGAGAGASRLVTGDHPLYGALEQRLARHKGSAAACVFGSGYLANAGIIPALIGAEDAVMIDALAHSCLWAGAQLARATVVPFRHNDLGHLEDLLAAERRRFRHVLVATEHVFSMDGDRAPLVALAALAEHFDAWLLADDAHGLGVIASDAAVPLQMGTLSKAIGSYGGYLSASEAVIDLVKTRARTLIYSTGLPPACVAAAITALDIIEENPDLAARPLAKARLFTQRLGCAPAESAIVPIVLGTAEAALAASAALAAEGFLVTAIRPPTVPAGTARLRLAFTAGHPEEEILRLAGLIERLIPHPGPPPQGGREFAGVR